jgi:hypothetical protein
MPFLETSAKPIHIESMKAPSKRSKQDMGSIEIGPYDIICGRNRASYNNVGNRRFRVTIRMFLERYKRLQGREERRKFITYLTKLFRNEVGFRFLKMNGDDDGYSDIGEIKTREKIGHALLDHNARNHQWPVLPPVVPPVMKKCKAIRSRPDNKTQNAFATKSKERAVSKHGTFVTWRQSGVSKVESNIAVLLLEIRKCTEDRRQTGFDLLSLAETERDQVFKMIGSSCVSPTFLKLKVKKLGLEISSSLSKKEMKEPFNVADQSQVQAEKNPQ